MTHLVSVNETESSRNTKSDELVAADAYSDMQNITAQQTESKTATERSGDGLAAVNAYNGDAACLRRAN